MNIAKLKIYLGKYLKKVKQGAEVIVLDHQHPVAKLVPYYEKKKINVEIIHPKKNLKVVIQDWLERSPQAKATQLSKSSLEYLLEDREER
ncbi:MAG: type II toxin-antitoxin system Phd/YefM family antitoxin [Deltaproteobacteria bacterium]|nr:type II toxin-antitoxin system Phd/YefM family antitoxin [Deltaproteobacteria bacterium]